MIDEITSNSLYHNTEEKNMVRLLYHDKVMLELEIIFLRIFGNFEAYLRFVEISYCIKIRFG